MDYERTGVSIDKATLQRLAALRKKRPELANTSAIVRVALKDWLDKHAR